MWKNFAPLISTSTRINELPDKFYRLEWDCWKTVNKEGQFYCLVDDISDYDDLFNLTLRLDMDKRFWVLCDGREWSYSAERKIFIPVKFI